MSKPKCSFGVLKKEQAIGLLLHNGYTEIQAAKHRVFWREGSPSIQIPNGGGSGKSMGENLSCKIRKAIAGQQTLEGKPMQPMSRRL